MSYTGEEYENWRHKSGIHHMMFDNRVFEAGSWGAEFHPDLAPGPNDVTIAPHNKNLDVFATTDRDVQLKRHGPGRRTGLRGPDSYEQMLRRYAPIAQGVLTTDEVPTTEPFRDR